MKMMPVAAMGVCLIGLLAQPILAQNTTQEAETATAPYVAPVEVNALFPPSPEWEKVNAQLDQKISNFTVDKQPLDAAINKLRDLTHLDVEVNWAAIFNAGVDKAAPITVDLHDVPVRRALTALLLAAIGNNLVNLDYTIHDGTVCVSSLDDLQSAKYQVIRHYEIDPLVQLEMKSPNITNDDAVKDIVSLITSTVAPDSWRDNGGTVGSIREMNHVLYINQTEKHQEEIRQLLVTMAAKAIPITRVYDVRPMVADADKAKSIQRLMDLEGIIRDHCPPDTWGNYGAMTARNGFLIISANVLSQTRIAALLDMVRKIDAQTAEPSK